MTTSGLYQFNAEVMDIISDSLQRCGYEPSQQSAVMVESAIYSLNMIFSDLANQQLNLWSVQPGIISLIPGQATYDLPQGTIDLTEVTMRSSSRQLGGTASASSGTAANAFDGDPATACTQNAPDGTITYDWGLDEKRVIYQVGVTSENQNSYTLAIEGSQDGSNWVQAYNAAEAWVYGPSQTLWYALKRPFAYRYMRIRETGGATLNIQELYFNSQTQDLVLSRMSRQEYTAIPMKLTEGRPTSFYVDRQINPIVSFWTAPSSQYETIFYNRITQMQDVTKATETIDVPYRFKYAITCLLAADMAIKYSAERAPALLAHANTVLARAKAEDAERVPLRLLPDISMYSRF